MTLEDFYKITSNLPKETVIRVQHSNSFHWVEDYKLGTPYDRQGFTLVI